MEDRWPGLLAESSTRIRGAYEVLPSGIYVQRVGGLKGMSHLVGLVVQPSPAGLPLKEMPLSLYPLARISSDRRNLNS